MKFTEEMVHRALNRACDDVQERLEQWSTGNGLDEATDATNVLVSVGLYYLKEPEVTFEEAIRATHDVHTATFYLREEVS